MATPSQIRDAVEQYRTQMALRKMDVRMSFRHAPAGAGPAPTPLSRTPAPTTTTKAPKAAPLKLNAAAERAYRESLVIECQAAQEKRERRRAADRIFRQRLGGQR